MTWSVDLPLRWSDLDAQNHVNNVTYLQYLQEARVLLLAEGPGKDMLRDGVVVVSHQIEYLRPIAYSDEPVRVEVSIADVGAASFTYAYEIRHGGELCARARTVSCPYDFSSQRPRRLGDEERAFLVGFKEASEPFKPIPWIGVGREPHLHDLAVRWSDQDWFRHVNNVHYLDFMQEARIKLVDYVGDEHLWLMARQDIHYRTPMSFRTEPYVVRSGVARIGTTSLTIVSDIVDSLEPNAVVHAQSTCVVVCADHRDMPVDLPESVRTRMSGYQVS